ncbi:apolipoprotein N-acyltransferase [bacterium]|nr:apolipoprotein N-acyltransferase [bacterium]
MPDKTKLFIASLFFVFCFALSFPFVIPGETSTVFLHDFMGWLLIFPVIPLFFYIVNSFSTLKKQILAVYAITIPANAFVFYWIFYSLNIYGGLGVTESILALLLMFTILGTFWLAFFLLCRFFAKKSEKTSDFSDLIKAPEDSVLPLKPWFIAVIWLAVEFLRTFFPVDFFWAALGHSQYSNKVVLQWASLGSVYIISFMIVWFSLYIYTLIFRKNDRREGMVLVAVLVLLCSYSAYQMISFKSEVPTKEIKIGLMQPAINQYDINAKESNVFEMIDVFVSQLNSFDRDSDLVVWHEAAMPLRIPVGFENFSYIMERYFPRAYDFKNQIVGMDMVDREELSFFNAAGFVQDGKIRRIYKKIKLAPFGEYLPYSEFLRSIGLSILVPGNLGDFIRGTEYTVYDFGGFKASVLICYDGTFSENIAGFVRNGAEILVNISNDAWFGNSSETFQHGMFYPFRAVETGRTIVRSANVGISEVLLPDGTVENSTRFLEKTTINRKVPLYDKETVYIKFGNWFVWLNYIVLGLFLLDRTGKKKSKN